MPKPVGSFRPLQAPPNGAPSVPHPGIPLDPVILRDLQIALLQQQVLQQQQTILSQQVGALLLRAGLDPQVRYQLNLQEGTATPQSPTPGERS